MDFKNFFSATNTLMENCFPELIDFTDSGSKLKCEISGLSAVLLSNIVVHQGCYLREEVPIPEQDSELGGFWNQTDYETSLNHFHTSNVLNNYKKGIHHLVAGMMIADHLRYKLKSQFPSVKFEILVSFNIVPFDEEDIYVRDDCYVSFHAVRDGEIAWDENLDDYKLAAVGMIEV